MAGYQKGKLPPKLAALNIAFNNIHVLTRREKDRNSAIRQTFCYLPSLSCYSLHLPTEGWPG